MTDIIKTKDITYSVDDTYCPLPFNHMNWHPNGNVSVCCVAEMFPPNDGFYKKNQPIKREMLNLKTHSVKELWEESSVLQIREDMLEGKRPAPCHGCYKIEDTGGTSRRQIETRRWGKPMKRSLQFIDLRMSNLCNSKCMMCYPDSSSALIKDYRKWQNALDFMSDNSTNYELFQWFDEDKINELLEYKDELKYLYINGGEPFIMEPHWEFLRSLIKAGVAKNIQISYNTNCSVYKPEFHEIWKEFKGVTLGMSVDGVGDVNQWIRSPINSWESINENIIQLAKTPSLQHVNITCTVQWLNLPYMEEFYEWALEMKKHKKYFSINQNFLTFPPYLSINCAPVEFKQKMLKQFENSKYKKEILTENMIAYLTSTESSEEHWSQGFRYMEEVSKTRGTHWKDIFTYDY